MPSKIILKKSSVAAKTPLVGDLDYGELALNYTDGKLYYKTASNTISYFTTGAAQGTVTSVAGTGTVSGLTLTGTVTSSGSLTLGGTLAVTPANFASQTANTVLAAPNGSAGTPTFRTLVAADIPTLNQNTTGTAASAPLLTPKAQYSMGSALLPADFASGIQTFFVGAAAGEGSWQSYGSVMNMKAYTSGGGGSLQLYVPYSPTYGGTGLQARFGNYDVATGNSWTAWKTLLASDNFNSYAPTLTGTGASGTWGISVTGSAGSVAWTNVTGRPTAVSSFTNDSGYITGSGVLVDKGLLATTGDWNTYTTAGVYQIAGASIGTNGPSGAYAYGQLIVSTNGNLVTQSYTAHTNAVQIWTRIKYNTSDWQPWVLSINSGNYNSYAPTLTGGGASGSWGISVTGSAGSVAWSGVTGRPTTLSAFTNDSGFITGSGSITGTAGSLTIDNTITWGRSGLQFVQVSGLGGTNPALTQAPDGNWWHIIRANHGNTGGYYTDLALPFTSDGGVQYRRISNGINNGWYLLLDSHNYNSYSPSLTGTGASGTWGISVTGSAGSVAWTNVSGRPTAVSSFTNDSGYITSSGTAARLTNFTSTTTVSAGTDNTESCTSYIGGISLFGQTDGALYSHVYSSSWKHNIFGDYRTGQLAVRGKNSGTWQAWRTVLDSGNYSSYALPLSGGTLTGKVTTQQTAGAMVLNDSSSSFEVRGPTSGSGDSNLAMIAFHVPSMYAIKMGVRGDGYFGIGGWSRAAWSWYTAPNGDMTSAGNVIAYSDERLKKDWISLPTNFVEQLAQVKSGTYTRTDTQERQAGSSAQDWQQLLPEVVTVGADDDKTLGLAYGNAALVSAIELAKRVVAQDKKIAHLEALVAQLINKG